MRLHTDVLIVGAGPVGLFLANECARRGIRYRLIEARSGQSEHSKALAVFPRTLEIFDMAGVVAPFLEVANRVTSVAVVARQRWLARVRFQPDDTPYSFVGMVPQDVTEKILVAELHRKSGAVEYDTTFVSAVEHDNHVVATMDQRGKQFEVTARFVVGCDGAHSAVRHFLNLPFEGNQYHDSFMLADVDTNEALPGDEMHLCPSEFGPLAIFPMSSTRRRIVATVAKTEEDAPSLAFVRKVVAERAPAGFEALSLRWSSYFRIHHRQVARLGAGRIFVAGDAAHIHSPFGGQGMNTGLQDAWNLVWKLGLAIRRRASEQLLESYTAERRPIIVGVLQTTDRLTRVMGTASKLAQVARDKVIPLVSRWEGFQRRLVQNLSELSISYRDSPIVDGDGRRFWNDSLRGGKGIENRFLLLLGEDTDEAARKAASEFCAPLADLVELRRMSQSGMALVRPDGYVACAGALGDSGTVLESMRFVLKRQTNSESL